MKGEPDTPLILDLEMAYSFEDYVEAMRAHDRQGEGAASRLKRICVGALTVGLLSAAAGSLMPSGPATVKGRLGFLVHNGPLILLLTGSVGISILNSRDRKATEKRRAKCFLYASASTARQALDREKRRRRHVPIWSAVTRRAAAVVFAAMIFICALALARLQGEYTTESILSVVAPFIAIGSLIIVILLGQTLSKQWKANVDLQSPHAAQFHADRLSVSNGRSGSYYHWDVVDRVIESPLTFVVYPKPNQFYIFPKRCFPDEAAIDVCRELLRAKVVERDVNPGFEVIPTARIAEPSSAPQE